MLSLLSQPVSELGIVAHRLQIGQFWRVLKQKILNLSQNFRIQKCSLINIIILYASKPKMSTIFWVIISCLYFTLLICSFLLFLSHFLICIKVLKILCFLYTTGSLLSSNCNIIGIYCSVISWNLNKIKHFCCLHEF